MFDSVRSDRGDYWIKTFGASLGDLKFYKLPTVVEQARMAVPDSDIVGYLICALEQPPQMTGLLLCDPRRLFPDGLPIRAPAISDRFWKGGYEVLVTVDGGRFVVAHWLYENGALDRFDKVH
jgi:hypothetical protein